MCPATGGAPSRVVGSATRDPCRSCASRGRAHRSPARPASRLRRAPPTGGPGERPAGAARRRDWCSPGACRWRSWAPTGWSLARRLSARDPQQRGLGVGSRDGAATVMAERARHLRRGGDALQARRPDHGVLIAVAALVIAAVVLDGRLAQDARVGGLGLGAVTAAGITASVYLDGLRAERLLVPRGGHGDRRRGAVPRPDAGPDPVGTRPRSRDRRQRGDAPDERPALARRRAPHGPAVPDAGERGPGPRDRSRPRAGCCWWSCRTW